MEVRTDAPLIAEGSPTPLVLDSKLAIIDSDKLFLSSTNIDPRSNWQNTEIGLLIESPDLASDMLSQWGAEMGDYVFDVVTGPHGEPVWRYEGAGIREISDGYQAGA